MAANPAYWSARKNRTDTDGCVPQTCALSSKKWQTVRSGAGREDKIGRKVILYDLYKDDEYQGRYKAKELMDLLGMSRETVASRVYHGVKAKDGYEIMRAEPDGWTKSWERACAPLRRK